MKNMGQIKKFRNWSGRSLMVAALMTIAFVLMLAAPPKAQAQYQPNFWKVLEGVPSFPSIIASNATTTVTNTAIVVRQGKGLAFMPAFVGTNSGTASITFNFEVSADGTNFSTTTPLKCVAAMNGTTLVRGYTNFPPALLDNVRAIKLVSWNNAHTANVNFSNMVWSYSNQ